MTQAPDILDEAIRLRLEIAELRRDVAELRLALLAARPLPAAPWKPAPPVPWDPQRPWDLPIVVCRSAVKSRPSNDTST